MLAVEKKTYEQAIAAGFDPRRLRDRELLSEFVVEVQPTPPRGGRIVWEWHAWDHLIQDFDPKKPNYGDPAAHPERIYVHGSGRGIPAFWLHANSIDYNPQLDQIMLSIRGFNELWVIDHSTTTEEARGHTGGRYGHGGDLLYRWGNPAAYRRGTRADRQLFQQHDAQWIERGLPGAGNILIFNNGLERGYSTIVELKPPIRADGRYQIAPSQPFGPEVPLWEYKAPNPSDFYSPEISGCQRLPNGNTLICAGTIGIFFEVTPQGETVWKYVNPVVRGGILAQGEVPGLDHRGHQWNAVFKIHRYPPDYPAFADKDLTPKGVIELPAGQATGLSGATEDRFHMEGGRRPRGRRGNRGGKRPPRWRQ